ncbi:MAG: hypothetical protein OXC98_11880 [bacterium]|nr:hypothetical protein [Acidimicrobiia bacterium]MCY4651051.1 hypothetical protein [bacterium]
MHLYVGKEWSSVYYDGSGDVVFLNEHELEEQGGSYTPPRLYVGPQHGAAVPLDGDLFAVTPQHPDYESDPEEYRLPIGADIMTLDGEVLHSETGCDALHGDASNGHVAVFGCRGGALFVEVHGATYGGGFVPAPTGASEDFRLTSLWGYPDLDHFFALGSEVGLYVVHPEEGFMEQLIPAAEGRAPINAAVSHDGRNLLVAMSNGELRMYDAHDLDLHAAASDFLTAPVETGFWARPHMATAPGAVYITDSVGGKVLMLDPDDLNTIDSWSVAGNPTKIAFVGLLEEYEAS